MPLKSKPLKAMPLKTMSWRTALLRRMHAAWLDGGVLRVFGVTADLWRDHWWDRRHHIDAGGLIPIETLVTEWAGLHDYFPSGRRTFHRLMAHIDIRPGVDVFVDVGSGKGRALFMAAQYPFKRIVGIEISEELNRIARHNLARWPKPLACADIDIRTADAARCAIPADATVLYLYNPFHGPALRALFAAIAQSHAGAPRRIWVVFNNTAHFREMEPEFPWLRLVARPALEHECGVYLIAPDAYAAGQAVNTGTLLAAV